MESWLVDHWVVSLLIAVLAGFLLVQSSNSESRVQALFKVPTQMVTEVRNGGVALVILVYTLVLAVIGFFNR